MIDDGMPNFGNIPGEFAAKRNASFTVLPVPYEATTTYKKGTARGPAAIIEASAQVELYDEELGSEVYRLGIRTLRPFAPGAGGSPRGRQKVARPELFLSALEKKIREVLASFPETRLVMLGGEHSITPAAVRVFAQRRKDLTVLHLDAHADLRDEYEGSKYNHACAMRRTAESCPLVQVGIRNISAEEIPFAKSGEVSTFYAHEWRNRPSLPGRVLSRLGRDVYVTIDVDVFDPACVPGTGTPEPGGLSWHEVLDVLRPVFVERNVVAFDVVELSPIEGAPASEFTAAKLVYRLMGYMAMRERRRHPQKP